MHDTLTYFARDPVHRRFHHDQLTFAMLYEYSERFIMPLSHDEVVHGKGSLLEKMPRRRLAEARESARCCSPTCITRPGKKLLFMGTELAPWTEWNHDSSLDWHLIRDPRRASLVEFIAPVGRDVPRAPGAVARRLRVGRFQLDRTDDRENSVLSYVRRDGEHHAIVVLNLTPVPRDHYRVGAPAAGAYKEILNSDAAEWGGAGYPTRQRVVADQSPFHGFSQSIELSLPPLSALVLAPDRGR